MTLCGEKRKAEEQPPEAPAILVSSSEDSTPDAYAKLVKDPETIDSIDNAVQFLSLGIYACEADQIARNLRDLRAYAISLKQLEYPWFINFIHRLNGIGACATVLGCVKRYHKNEDVQTQSVALLTHITPWSALSRDLEAVETVLYSAKRYSSNTLLQYAALLLLGNIMSPNSYTKYEEAEKFALLGGVDWLFDTMKTHKAEAHVQDGCCYLISCFMLADWRNAKPVLDRGGLSLVSKAIEVHSNCQRVLNSGRCALQILINSLPVS